MTSNNVVKANFNKKHLWKIILIVIVVVGLFVLKSSIVIVDSGEIGVPVLFGKVQSYIIEDGLSIVNPMIKVVRYPVRIQEYTMSSQADRGSVKGDDAIDIKTSDGISVRIDMTVWWYIDETKAFTIYRKIAKDSREIEPKILRPATRAVMRDVAVQFTMEELYTGKRDQFTNTAIERMKNIIEEKNLVLNKVLIRSIKLPNQVEEAISRKMKTKQESDEMEYRKEIAEKTAEI
ncbi:MAG: prohibitin family protein [bacterium]